MPSLQIPETWDGEADVIVVGAGTAGLPAAITAADRGAEVIILETWSGPASSLALIAGGTPFAGTDLQQENGIQDSPEELFREAVETSGGSPELWRVVADTQLETYEWLKGLGAKAVELWSAPGNIVMRIHRWEGHGAHLLKILRETAESKGIKILFRHRARSLVLNPETNRVIGIKAEHADETLNFKARKAVILATGGFIRNKELVKEYGPYYANCVPVTPPTHLGDGLKMALDLGAATEGIGLAVCPSISVCTETNRTTTLHGSGSISVTRDARRWADEAGPPYTITLRELIRQYPDGAHFVIYDSKIREVASPESYRQVKEYKKDSIKELAQAVGLHPEALVETVSEYNSNIDKYGYDIKYGRRSWGASLGNQPPPKIDTPPFYAVKCKVSLSSLKGGIRINTRAQVMNQYGDVIPGLYAAGEITGGLTGKPEAYYTGSMTLGAFVFGRLAGENATAL